MPVIAWRFRTTPNNICYLKFTGPCHHLDSWIKIDQLDVTCFIISLFTGQHFSNIRTSIFRSLRFIVNLFHVLYFSGSMCVGVTVWFGWGWVVSLCRLKACIRKHKCFSLRKDTTPPQPNHTVTPTHIESEKYNTWNKSTVSRKLLKMDVLTFETCWAVNSEIIKQVTSSWSIFIQLFVFSVHFQFRHTDFMHRISLRGEPFDFCP